MHKKTEKADMPEHRGCHNLFFKGLRAFRSERKSQKTDREISAFCTKISRAFGE